LELVALPNVLFLDEPTSGLDATASLEILGALADMAKLGMTVASVIHQPRYSLFTKFENTILMGKGRPVYIGPSRDALQYFVQELGLECPEAENPADFFLDMITIYPELPLIWSEKIEGLDTTNETSVSQIELFKNKRSFESNMDSTTS
jgi:ABC-type multidrug transport system ATPase subunit